MSNFFWKWRYGGLLPVGCFPDVETHGCGLVTPGHTSGQREVHTCSRGGPLPQVFLFGGCSSGVLVTWVWCAHREISYKFRAEGVVRITMWGLFLLGVSDLVCLCFSRLLGSSCLMAGSSGGSQVSGYLPAPGCHNLWEVSPTWREYLSCFIWRGLRYPISWAWGMGLP